MVRTGIIPLSRVLTHISTAKEIENLRQESQALKQIRNSMRSAEFPRQVFDKVFKDDINRLRSMEDMWKIRAPPQALIFDQIAKNAQTIDPTVSQQDQTTWTLAESFVVFRDRYERTRLTATSR